MEWDEAKIHAEISHILGEWGPYMDVRINRKDGKRLKVDKEIIKGIGRGPGFNSPSVHIYTSM